MPDYYTVTITNGEIFRFATLALIQESLRVTHCTLPADKQPMIFPQGDGKNWEIRQLTGNSDWEVWGTIVRYTVPTDILDRPTHF